MSCQQYHVSKNLALVQKNGEQVQLPSAKPPSQKQMNGGRVQLPDAKPPSQKGRSTLSIPAPGHA